MQVLELCCSHQIMFGEHFSSHASYVSFPAKMKSDIPGVAEHYWHLQVFWNQIGVYLSVLQHFLMDLGGFLPPPVISINCLLRVRSLVLIPEGW